MRQLAVTRGWRRDPLPLWHSPEIAAARQARGFPAPRKLGRALRQATF